MSIRYFQRAVFLALFASMPALAETCWQGSTQTDAFDDSETIIAALYAKTKSDIDNLALSLVFGKAYVALACQDSKLAVLFDFNTIGGVGNFLSDTAEVRYRFDKDDSQSGDWRISTGGGDTVFVPTHKTDIFARNLVERNKLVIGASSDVGPEEVREFDLTAGCKEEAYKVLETCGLNFQH